jgi:hypothetical protein
LAAGSNCIIKVTFTPTQLKKRTGNIAITDNAPGSPQNVPLTGSGLAPVALSPSSASFGTLAVGTTGTAKVFTLTNNLSAAVSGVSLSTAGDYSVTSTTCTTSLAAKTKCTVSVAFKPTATGTRKGTLSVSDTASNSPQKSSLTGTGN